MTLPGLTAGSGSDTWNSLFTGGATCVPGGQSPPNPFNASRGGWDLEPGFIVVLGHGSVGTQSLATIVDELKSSFATDAGAAAVAYRVDLLWNSTTRNIQVEIGSDWHRQIRESLAPAPIAVIDLDEVDEVDEVEPTSIDPAHTRLAHELKALTGLPAATLGSAAGVTREQYQRWLRGDAISDAKHGQLIYLHTIARDASRRLGEGDAKLWWRTPGESGDTPEALLKRRRLDIVYGLVAELPDLTPLRDGVLQGLLTKDEGYLDDDLPDDGAAGAWSPYGDGDQ